MPNAFSLCKKRVSEVVEKYTLLTREISLNSINLSGPVVQLLCPTSWSTYGSFTRDCDPTVFANFAIGSQNHYLGCLVNRTEFSHCSSTFVVEMDRYGKLRPIRTIFEPSCSLNGKRRSAGTRLSAARGGHDAT